MTLDDLETPAAVVDLDRLEANIDSLQLRLDGLKLQNRPHIKTHRIPEIALMQMRAGAAGVTCQKLAEAEVMAAAGVRDIFLPYNILGSSKKRRLLALASKVKISVTVDSEATAAGLSEAFAGNKEPLEVLVEFDTGQGRCGVQNPGEARALALKISKFPGLRFGGLMTHPHNERSDSFVGETRALLEKDGVPTTRVSYGGTPELKSLQDRKEATEYRSGGYVYGDRFILSSGAMREEDCALTVLATVVSRPTPERAILDAGSKALSSDLLGFEDYGSILEYPGARIKSLSEEHGWVFLSRSEPLPAVGDRVTLRPNHCCVVSNLFNRVAGVRQGKVEVQWDVAARGASQ